MSKSLESQMRIDSKGKYYTKVVSKEALEVLVRLRSGETVQGMIHIRPGRRLSDEMNDAQPFLSVTGAVIRQGDEELYQVSFLTINRHAILWAIPVQAIGESADDLDQEEEE